MHAATSKVENSAQWLILSAKICPCLYFIKMAKNVLNTMERVAYLEPIVEVPVFKANKLLSYLNVDDCCQPFVI